MPILDFAFLKNRYDFELDRKEKLTAALTLPVGVLSVLGGALIAMLISPKPFELVTASARGRTRRRQKGFALWPPRKRWPLNPKPTLDARTS